MYINKMQAYQKELLMELAEAMNSQLGTDISPMEKRKAWKTIGAQLNAVKDGVKKTPFMWKRVYMSALENAKKREYKKQKIRESYLRSLSAVEKNFPNPQDDPVCLDTEEEIFDLINSPEQRRKLIRMVSEIVINERKKEGDAITKLCKQKSRKCKKIHVWLEMRRLTIDKLNMLLISEDCNESIEKSEQMDITDWLLFDTVLVHQESFNVIGFDSDDMHIMKELFVLVMRFHIEDLTGDDLAIAWSFVTLHYNNSKRHCTPMLLQRRWYQLKASARTRFYKFWLLCKSVLPNSMLDAKTRSSCRPTYLLTAIVKRFPSIVVEPFLSWEALILQKRVILREQFELIALNKRSVRGNSLQIPSILHETLTNTTSINDEPEDVEMNILENVILVPENEVTQESGLPKIANVFSTSNATTKFEIPDRSVINLNKNSNIQVVIFHENIPIAQAVDVENCAEVIADSPEVFKDMDRNDTIPNVQAIDVQNPVEVIADIPNIFKDMDRNDARIQMSNGYSEERPNIEGAVTKKTEFRTAVDEKRSMDPKVITVKLEDMGIPNLNFNNYVLKDKRLIDIINFKSKPYLKKTLRKPKVKKATMKVKLSSPLFKKPRILNYDPLQLKNNPDFNIALNVDARYFKSYDNRVLLNMCVPITIDVSKEFEKKLINGTMYLNTCDADENLVTVSPSYPSGLDVPLDISSDSEDDVILVETEKIHPIVPKPLKVYPQLRENNQETVKTNNILQFLLETDPQARPPLSTRTIEELTKAVNVVSENPNPGPSKTKPDISDYKIDIKILNSIFELLSKTEIESGPIVDTNTPPRKIIAVNASESSDKLSYNQDGQTFCCWSRRRIYQIQCNKRLTVHNCPYPSCFCCCSEDLKHFFYKFNEGTTQNQNETRENTIKTYNVSVPRDLEQIFDPQGNVENQSTAVLNHQNSIKKPITKEPTKRINQETKPQFSDMRYKNIFPETYSVSTQKRPNQDQEKKVARKHRKWYRPQVSNNDIVIDEKNILLSTIKIPPNFKAFLEFHDNLKRVVTLPHSVELKLAPTGLVTLTKTPNEQIPECTLSQLKYLIKIFYMKNGVHKVASRDTQDMNINEDKFTESNSIEKSVQVYTHSKKLKDNVKENQPCDSSLENFKIRTKEIDDSDENTIGDVGTGQSDNSDQRQENYLNNTNTMEAMFSVQQHVIKSNSLETSENSITNKIRSSLGPFLSKTLTQITSVAELNYACSHNGLFFKLDLGAGVLVPININKYFTETGIKMRHKKYKTTCPNVIVKKSIQLKVTETTDQDEIHDDNNSDGDETNKSEKYSSNDSSDDEPIIDLIQRDHPETGPNKDKYLSIDPLASVENKFQTNYLSGSKVPVKLEQEMSLEAFNGANVKSEPQMEAYSLKDQMSLEDFDVDALPDLQGVIVKTEEEMPLQVLDATNSIPQEDSYSAMDSIAMMETLVQNIQTLGCPSLQGIPTKVEPDLTIPGLTLLNVSDDVDSILGV